MNALKCRGRSVMGGASSVGAHRGSNGTAAVIPEPGGSGLTLGHAAQDHPARFKEFGSDLAEFIAIGTAVKSDHPPTPDGGTWRNNKNQPFTSDLSGQDFW